jgi:hypothetical protein
MRGSLVTHDFIFWGSSRLKRRWIDRWMDGFLLFLLRPEDCKA